MKKIFSFLLVSAAVLAMAACQKEQQAVDTPENGVKEVTTQFVLNIAAAPSTKMTADAVQQAGNFRGIQDAKLYTYKSGVTSGTPYVLSTTGEEEKKFDFGAFFASSGLDNSTGNNQSGENAVASKRVLQLSIPVGVDAVTFYGRATKAGGAKDADFGATNDSQTTISGTPQNTVIAAQKILSDGSVVDSYDATARLMIFIINDILSRGVDEDPDGTFGILPKVTWAQYGHRYEADNFPSTTRYGKTQTDIDNGLVLDHSLEGLEEVLGKSYYLFTYILPVSAERPHGEYRAGSSTAIKKMVLDMYRIITAANSAVPTNLNEENAKRLAKIVLDRAMLYFNTDKEDEVPDGDFKNLTTIKTLMTSQYNIVDTDYWNANFTGAADLNKYPYEAFGVPDGAAQLGFYFEGENVGGVVKTKDELFYRHPNYPLVNPTMQDFEPRKYLYPAELWYYVNSPIRTTSNDVTVASYPDGVTPWNTSSSWTGWTFPGKVEGSTRGVAVVNSINYGVAMLKTNVVYKEGTTVLEDNRYELTNHAESNKTIAPADAQIELRGVLVGGVNPRMNWQFTRKNATGELSAFDGVIYDHSIASATIPTPTGSPNYTLVYDNYNSSEEEANQNDVYVALEFVNKGEAFYGRDNMIPNGGVFYLVAKIEKPNADQRNTLHAAFPTDHQIPPVYGVDGEAVPDGMYAGQSKKIARVFIQDFVTNATFRIGQYSLQNAYYSVPDLRASQMSLGLSVDLQWIPGINYVLDL